MNVIQRISDAIVILDEVDNYFKSIPEKQSENDMTISDIYCHTLTPKKLIKRIKRTLINKKNFKRGSRNIKNICKS